MTLPCIVCDRALESAVTFPEGEETNQPYAGTTFISHGQYGSTVFDPFDRSFLEINICDPCLLKKKAVVLHTFPTTVTTNKTRPWEPE